MSYTFQDGQTLCPYNPSHVLSQMRSLTHLVKCRKQHPHLAESISICAFNQGHHIPMEQMSEHLKVCKEYSSSQSYNKTPVSQSSKPSSFSFHQTDTEPKSNKSHSQVDTDIDEWM